MAAAGIAPPLQVKHKARRFERAARKNGAKSAGCLPRRKENYLSLIIVANKLVISLRLLQLYVCRRKMARRKWEAGGKNYAQMQPIACGGDQNYIHYARPMLLASPSSIISENTGKQQHH